MMWGLLYVGEDRLLVQAHAAAATSMADVEAVMAALLHNAKIKRATHNIMAYRIAQERTNTFLQVADQMVLQLQA